MRPEVRRWFARRTSAAADWPLPVLLERKGASRISVVLPALDEEATVGAIVGAIHRELLDRHPLVDEIVVMDSGSTDATAAVATDAGARVVHRDDVLPAMGSLPGKGEVLWKSLQVTTGDLLVFVDADLRDFTTSFVTGLLGPLLTDPTVQLVKATYDRPLTHDQTAVPAGGGRVTELVARPLINLHWPLLAGFVQPLGGEYAARRGLLERLPFPVGYGVEFGLLVDTLALAGLDAMAQVDLSRRKHRNQSNAKLGRMAAEIMQVAEARLGRPLPRRARLTQFDRGGDGYLVTVTDVTEQERPPMLSVPAYRRQHARAS